MNRPDLEKYGYEFVLNKRRWLVRNKGRTVCSGVSRKNTPIPVSEVKAVEAAIKDFIIKRVQGQIVEPTIKTSQIYGYKNMSAAAQRYWSDSMFKTIKEDSFLGRMLQK